MTIRFVADTAVDLPEKFESGQVLDETMASVLNREYMTRLTAQIRWRIDRGEITQTNLKIEALAMANKFKFTIADTDDDDPIQAEAEVLARELIIQQLAKDGITITPKLDEHVKVLAKNSPELRAKAKERLEIRYRIAKSAVVKFGGV